MSYVGGLLAPMNRNLSQRLLRQGSSCVAVVGGSSWCSCISCIFGTINGGFFVYLLVERAEDVFSFTLGMSSCASRQDCVQLLE